MILTEFHKELLKRIKAGEKSFSPAGIAVHKLKAFQAEAEAIIELEQFGLIALKVIQHENASAERFYELIIVEGLTLSGRKVRGSRF